jgi:hypothetical protein
MSYIILRGRWFHIIVLNVHAPTEDKTDDVKDRLYKELERIFNKFPKYHMKILLGNLNAKVGRENIFKSTIGNENLHKISNDNGVRVVNFATSKNLIKSTIHKYSWTSPDGKTHNEIDLILIDRPRHSSILDVRSFKAADCDTDHCLVVAESRERLAGNKQGSHKFHLERFNIKKSKKLRVKSSIVVRFHIHLQHWKIWMLRLKLILSGKRLQRI